MGRSSRLAPLQYNLGHQANRLETFKKHEWVYDESVPCSPTQLSAAGFYAVTSESARCHYCQKEMEGWEATDVPWEEHKSHSPQCPFVKFYSSPPKEVLIIDAIKLERERLLYQLKLEHQKAVAAIMLVEKGAITAIERRYTRKL